MRESQAGMTRAQDAGRISMWLCLFIHFDSVCVCVCECIRTPALCCSAEHPTKPHTHTHISSEFRSCHIFSWSNSTVSLLNLFTVKRRSHRESLTAPEPMNNKHVNFTLTACSHIHRACGDCVQELVRSLFVRWQLFVMSLLKSYFKFIPSCSASIWLLLWRLRKPIGAP